MLSTNYDCAQPAKFHHHIRQFPSRPLDEHSSPSICHNRQNKMYNDIQSKQSRNSIQDWHHGQHNHSLNILTYILLFMSSVLYKFQFIFTLNLLREK